MSTTEPAAPAETQWHFHARILLLHPTENHVLLHHEALPAIDHTESLYMGNKVAGLLEAYSDLVFLQRLSIVKDKVSESEGHVHYVFALVKRTADLPKGCRWADPSALSEDVQEFALQALNPSPRLPWRSRGWLDQAISWADQALQKQGLERTGQPEMVKAWEISVLYKLPIQGGTVFLKAVPDYFEREGPLTRWLSGLHPGAAPEVLALDPEQNIFLLKGAGHEKVGPEKAQTAVQLLATLQRKTESRTGELLQLGCLDRGCQALKQHVQDLLVDDGALGAGDLLTPEEQIRLKNTLPVLHQMLDDLDSSPIPSTLVHGDVHLGNVVSEGDTLTFLDWSDGSVSHPFIDMNSRYLLDSENPDELQQLTDSYLQAWTDVLPLEDLRELHKKAVLAGELHRAVSYHRYIIPGVGGKSDWDDAYIWHLKNVLNVLER
ncbi:phosphotransferase [Deinococcus roseus]|uniref:Aminoglycoside phosphotransferase domain-containing protein n=1 Tax=Deinococcus roseus TaxID=392414 RepID=A0ABQ2CYP1_9DEIO|nr:phosphotransferase [Deinococcus roseus]GGJ27398.1 hypothetical protein GCM10008938_11860 [Deinococcus roseus]